MEEWTCRVGCEAGQVYPGPYSRQPVHSQLRGARHSVQREKLLPYVPKPLAEIRLGIQRIAVIWPVEEQVPSDNRVQAREGVPEATLGEGEISPGNPEESSLTLVEPKASDHQEPNGQNVIEISEQNLNSRLSASR